MVEDEIRKWERPGKKLEPWPKAGSTGDASWKPSAPEGVKGNKSVSHYSVTAGLWSGGTAQVSHSLMLNAHQLFILTEKNTLYRY
jgi:hypothetical protein